MLTAKENKDVFGLIIMPLVHIIWKEWHPGCAPENSQGFFLNNIKTKYFWALLIMKAISMQKFKSKIVKKGGCRQILLIGAGVVMTTCWIIQAGGCDQLIQITIILYSVNE